jgi:hypothetical protein
MEAEMPTIAEQEARKEAPVRIVDEAKAPKSAAFLRTWTSGYLAGFKKALELAAVAAEDEFNAEFATILDEEAEVRGIQHLNRLRHNVRDGI